MVTEAARIGTALAVSLPPEIVALEEDEGFKEALFAAFDTDIDTPCENKPAPARTPAAPPPTPAAPAKLPEGFAPRETALLKPAPLETPFRVTSFRETALREDGPLLKLDTNFPSVVLT